MFIDDQLYFKQDTTHTRNPDGSHPFRDFRHSLILNSASGNKGGDPSRIRRPLEYEVDYIRAYQKKEGYDWSLPQGNAS